MATTTDGFGVSISAIDNATKTIDRINKQLSLLSAPAEKFNKAASKFGDVSGLSKLTEGMGALGSKSLDAFRSLDRVAPMLATITGAASLAGMSALIDRWAKLGQQTAIASQRLGLPTDRLTALQGAARLAGLSAEDLTSGLGQLDEKLRGATFNRDPQAIQTFNALHVAFRNADGSARDAGAAFGDVADGIKKLNDEQGRGAALRAAQGLGLEPLFALLLKGRQGIQDLQGEAARHGVVISPEAAKQAAGLAKSITGAEESVEGLGNTIVKDLQPVVGPMVDNFSRWLDTNRSLIGVDVAGWIKSITDAASNMNKDHLWVLLGAALGFKVGGWRGAVIGAGIGYSYERSQTDMGPAGPGANEHVAPNTPFSWLNPGTWLSGNHAPGTGPFDSTGSDSSIPRGIRNNNPLNLSYMPGQGAVGNDGRFGIYGSMEDGIAAEERQLLRYQDQGDNTLRKIITRWAPPSENDTEGYIADAARRTGLDADTPLNLRDADQAQRVISAMGWHESGRQIDTRAIQSGVDQGINGQVHVTVTLKGAPAGTTAAAAASGRASVAPPRVETAMPYAGAS